MSKWFDKGFGGAGGLLFLLKHDGNHPRIGSDPHFARGMMEGATLIPLLAGTPCLGGKLIGS